MSQITIFKMPQFITLVSSPSDIDSLSRSESGQFLFLRGLGIWKVVVPSNPFITTFLLSLLTFFFISSCLFALRFDATSRESTTSKSNEVVFYVVLILELINRDIYFSTSQQKISWQIWTLSLSIEVVVLTLGTKVRAILSRGMKKNDKGLMQSEKKITPKMSIIKKKLNIQVS